MILNLSSKEFLAVYVILLQQDVQGLSYNDEASDVVARMHDELVDALDNMHHVVDTDIDGYGEDTRWPDDGYNFTNPRADHNGFEDETAVESKHLFNKWYDANAKKIESLAADEFVTLDVPVAKKAPVSGSTKKKRKSPKKKTKK